MSRKNILLVIKNASTHGCYFNEALDLALAAEAMNQSVSLLFLGDGIYQLTKKNFTNELNSIDNLKIYAEQSLIESANIAISRLTFPLTLVPQEGLARLFSAQNTILTF